MVLLLWKQLADVVKVRGLNNNLTKHCFYGESVKKTVTLEAFFIDPSRIPDIQLGP